VVGAPDDRDDIHGLVPIRRRSGVYVGDLGDSRTLSACVVESVRTLFHAEAERVIVTVSDDTTFELVGEEAGRRGDRTRYSGDHSLAGSIVTRAPRNVCTLRECANRLTS